MSMTVVVTRNVPDRYRGFLASVMVEVSPGTYVSPAMNAGVRKRVWQVCSDWSSSLPPEACVTMLWRRAEAPSRVQIDVLGAPKTRLVDHDGMWLDHHDLTEYERTLLKLGAAPDRIKPAL